MQSGRAVCVSLLFLLASTAVWSCAGDAIEPRGATAAASQTSRPPRAQAEIEAGAPEVMSAKTAAFAASLAGRMPDLLSRNTVVGAQVALVDHGAVVWTGGFGQASAADGRRVDDHTVFQVASISKGVSAWGVL